jgi:hypothetical protein
MELKTQARRKIDETSKKLFYKRNKNTMGEKNVKLQSSIDIDYVNCFIIAKIMSTILHKGLGKFYKFFKASFREDLLTT